MAQKTSITAKTMVLCVIGHPIEHSMSPTMHNAAIQDLELDYVYIAYDIHPNNLEKAVQGFKALNITGINVTIPHKETIMKYLDEIDPVAQKIGAINTIKKENDCLKARNTDALGGKQALKDAGCKTQGKNILFLGSGGVSRALCYVLAEEVNKIVLTDIIEARAVALAKEIKATTGVNIDGFASKDQVLKQKINDIDILINATPIGMYPKVNDTPISKEFLHSDLFVFDVVYNPLETQLMKDATKIGCRTLGGLDMLVNQGATAFEWWTGKKPNSTLMKKKIIEFLGIK